MRAAMFNLYLLEEKGRYKFHIQVCESISLRILADYEFTIRSEK